jgi:hypothetical protein
MSLMGEMLHILVSGVRSDLPRSNGVTAAQRAAEIASRNISNRLACPERRLDR